MIIALMVPAPVAAKSKTTAKKIKTVTEYGPNYKDGKWNGTWTQYEKDTYTYDSKGNLETLAMTSDYDYLFGVLPVGGDTFTKTYKYTYKGKKLKTRKVKDTSGTIIEEDKYNKKGYKVSSVERKYGRTDWNPASVRTETKTMTYDGKGNNTSTLAFITSDESGETESWTEMTTKVYMGSMTLATTTNSVDSKDAVKETTVTSNGLVSNKTYSFDYDGKEVWKRTYVAMYTMSKGMVKEAVVYDTTDGKMDPVRRFVFTYNKDKISKSEHKGQVNDRSESVV